jgi:hypothetical protein
MENAAALPAAHAPPFPIAVSFIIPVNPAPTCARRRIKIPAQRIMQFSVASL